MNTLLLEEHPLGASGDIAFEHFVRTGAPRHFEVDGTGPFSRGIQERYTSFEGFVYGFPRGIQERHIRFGEYTSCYVRGIQERYTSFEGLVCEFTCASRNGIYSFDHFKTSFWEKIVLFFLSLGSCFLKDLFKNFGLEKLLRLQDVATFRSDHPRKKSGIQLRSQII